jgi:putative DNA primase/helicase
MIGKRHAQRKPLQSATQVGRTRTGKTIRYPHTDVGNAELFAALNAGHVCYDHKRKRWLLWDAHWWTEDVDGQMMRLARDAARDRLKTAHGMKPSKDRNSELAFARKTESKARLEAMLGLAQNETPLADKGEEWDNDPWLFGVTNGVIDLRTGKLRHGRPQDRITLHSPVVYDPKAQALAGRNSFSMRLTGTLR